MAELRLRHVTVRRGGRTVLDDVTADIGDGELVAVVGQSGSGKTTLLRVVAGLDLPDVGTIELDGVDATSHPPRQRDVAMVFQEAVLVPNWDVRRNVAFPLEIRHQHVDEVRARVDAEVRALHLEALARRAPDELSAGERQLVQIARAMVRVPRLLLLDEPLAKLDASLRDRMRHDLVFLQRGYGVTTLVATNDPIEAMSMADRLMVLEEGRMTQLDVPLHVYENPATLGAARATGDLSSMAVQVTADADGYWLEHAAFRLRAWHASLDGRVGRRVLLVVRPGWLAVDGSASVPATVERVVRLGSATHLSCRLGNDLVTVAAPAQIEVAVGDRIRLRIERWSLFDPVTADRIG